jgi:porphobilinogen synthase
MLGRPLPGLEKFIWPVFVRPGEGGCDAIGAMPGQFRYTVDRLIAALEAPVRNGLGGVLLFGVPADGDKDGQGSHAADPDGVVPAAVRAVRRAYPGVLVFTDVCLCAYTDHGHCGPLDENGCVDNDRAIAQLAEIALAHAAAGAHGVAPSAMMDGQVAAIRAALDNAGRMQTILMSYSTKFASGFYGPFREAEVSSPRSGDRRGYQADYQNLRAALRESRLDEEEGADILMVKPSMLYLDVIQRLRHQTDLPIAAYNVSGEYSMLIAAAERGWGDLRAMVRENIAALARAGADIFISYWAGRYEEWRDG